MSNPETTVPTIYRFGEFRLDSAIRELRRRDAEIPLQRKAFDCLVYLLEHRDRAIPSQELFDAVWGDVQLSESVLRQAILAIRRALNDGDNELVKTVWGFGYRWSGPMDTGGAPASAVTTRGRWQAASLLLLLAILLAGVMAVVAVRGDRGHDVASPPGTSTALETGEVALVLPVTADVGAQHAWVRLGLMDLIGSRLRAAGQSVVPSDTVVALLHGRDAPLDADEIERLAATTGAQLALGARAELFGERWRVSLHSLLGPRPRLTAFGEAADAVDAARIAADRMALALGQAPAPNPDVEPGLSTLIQQIEAARLAQSLDVARELVESAAPSLRRRPELRLEATLLDRSSHDFETNRRAYEELLDTLPEDADPVLRARALNLLGMEHFRHGSVEAEPVWEQATQLLERHGQREAQVELGRLHVLLGTARALTRGIDAARQHFVRGRALLESTGDVRGVAWLDNNLGALEVVRERHAEALGYFERTAESFRTLDIVTGELRALASSILCHLTLLDVPAALAVEPRLNELIARTEHPEVLSYGLLARARLLSDTGRMWEAGDALDHVLRITVGQDELYGRRLQALTLIAERALERGDAAAAARHAGEVVDHVPSPYAILEPRERDVARLVLIRAQLARDESTTEARRFHDAETASSPAAGVYEALMRAEIAAASDSASEAADAFERGLELADAGRVPLLLLRVCDAYVRWLLDPTRGSERDTAKALIVASRLDAHAEAHFGAALVQLRAHHAASYAGAWRTALTRARALAGEREVPAALLAPPTPRPAMAVAR